MKKITIRPLNDYVLFESIDTSAIRPIRSCETGLVRKVGPLVRGIESGDLVIYRWSESTCIEEPLRIIREQDVLAVTCEPAEAEDDGYKPPDFSRAELAEISVRASLLGDDKGIVSSLRIAFCSLAAAANYLTTRTVFQEGRSGGRSASQEYDISDE